MRKFSVSGEEASHGPAVVLSIRLAMIAHLALLAALAFGQSTPATLPSVLLTRASEIHELPADQASRGKVHLVGTVTYYDPLDYDLFVQDASGGVFVATTHPYPIHNRDLVEITGATHSGYRTEIAPDPTIRVLGHGQKFTARRYEYAELATGKEDSQLVTIRGKVRALDIEQHENASYMHLDVGMVGGEVEVYLGSTAGFDPKSALGSLVEITAVAGGVFDAKTQLTGIVLYAPDASAIHRLSSSKVDIDQLPLTDIDKVFEAQRIDDTSRRVRVRGAVTYYRKGDAVVLEGDGKSIFVQTRETNDLAIGDVVDAYGLPSNRDYAPSLRQAILIKTGGHEQIEPRAVSYTDAFSGIYSDNLISLSGVLISQLRDGDTNTLVMNIGGHLVNGSLRGKTSLPTFPLGSRIRIAGICRIVPGGPWRAPVLFHLEMRDASDIQVLSEPSWWTVGHLFGLVGALLVLALVITVWAVILKKQVGRQTDRINRSMVLAGERSRILEKISSNHNLDAILAEICKSVMVLLPGFACSYCFTVQTEPAKSDDERAGVSDELTYFELPLHGGGASNAIGKVVVSGPRSLVAAEDQQEVYATLSELATLAVERLQLHQQLVHHSTHDPLTELPNRRLCDSKLQSALEDAVRQEGQLAIVYIDLNGFKQVNDRYGHKIGDLYLKEIGARLHVQMRSADTLARIGGDEFLVIAPVTQSTSATALVKRLQACFEQPFQLDEHKIEGSASFGLALYPQDGNTAEELKRNADQSMYCAKRKAAEMPEAASRTGTSGRILPMPLAQGTDL
jgi:diguanylate cyclase (GGDEF)-like protein